MHRRLVDADLERQRKKAQCCCCVMNLRKAIGVMVLMLVVLIWVASSDLMQYIFTNQSFSKPFFLTYWDTSCFSIYLLGFFKSSWRQDLINPRAAVQAGRLSVRDTVKLSATFGVFWFLANYSFNASLTMTSVSSNTIINSLSGLFTLILGAMLKVDIFSCVKLLAVLLSFLGVVLVSLQDSSGDGSESFFGDMLCVFSAFMYGVYIVLLKLRIPDENKVNMPMFFGFLGLLNAVCLWPLFFILHWTGIEPWSWPNYRTMLFLCINSFIGTVLSDYLWLWSVILTSPLISTLGLSLTIPVALASDFVLGNHPDTSLVYLTGCGLVLAGFFLINFPAHRDPLSECARGMSSLPSCLCCRKKVYSPLDQSSSSSSGADSGSLRTSSPDMCTDNAKDRIQDGTSPSERGLIHR